MSILIKGMEMPKSYEDIRIYADGRVVSKSLYKYGEEIATAVPAADVRPVVRGKWNAVKGALHPAETSAVCSNCGFATMIHAQTFYNFCPNCGADMREE